MGNSSKKLETDLNVAQIVKNKFGGNGCELSGGYIFRYDGYDSNDPHNYKLLAIFLFR